MPHFRCIAAVLCSAVLLGSAHAAEEKTPLDPSKIFRDPASHAYFPKGRESFYTSYLAAMKEPSLITQPKSADVFALRFTWLRSFHDPIAIRIWREGTEYRVRAVRLVKQQDYSLGPTASDTTRNLTKDELSEIQRLTGSKNLWKPLSEDEEILMSSLNDGSAWIFERRSQQGYSMMDLRSPNYFTPEKFKEFGLDITKITDLKGYVRLGLYLLKITKLLPDEHDIY